MSRITFRTLLAVFAVALVAVVPAIATAHKNGKSDSSGKKTVGTIVSFTDGTLVISSGGLPVSGTITLRTRIKWADRGRGHDHGKRRGHDDRGRSSRRGADDGPNHDKGDDRGGRHQSTRGGMPTGGGLPHASAGDLKPGAAVRKAKLTLTADGPVWDEIKLVRPAPVPAT